MSSADARLLTKAEVSSRGDVVTWFITEENKMIESKFILEEVTDPAEIARSRAQDERAGRNYAWLQAHWQDVLPQARGRFLAVAGQEAFIADAPAEAWKTARDAHPEDDGAISQYVPREGGPRIYDHRG
jgi:hypothetical protein